MIRLWAIAVLLVACGEVVPNEVTPDGPGPDADPCTGTCECRVDTDCAAEFTGCNDQVTSRTCDCVAGYTEGLSGACEFTGLVQDPGFQAAATWNVGRASIDQNLNEPGMVEPGAARFNGPEGLCGIARITQTVTMPKLSRSEAFVAQIAYRYRDPQFFDFVAPAFGIGAGWQENLPIQTNAFATQRVCIGSAQYASESAEGLGEPREIAIMPQRVPFVPGECMDTNIGLDVDRFDIVVANPDECPAPGGATNGDVESTGGWTLTGSSANGNPFSTTIEANIGEGNSRAVRLFARNRCSNLSATNKVSVPASDIVASPALSFFNRTSAVLAGIETTPRLGGVVLNPIPSGAGAITQRVCLPAFTRGGIHNFEARLDLSGTCADQPNAESIIDSLEIVNDPSCGTDSLITDPGFESPLPLIGAQSTPGRSLARALNDPAQAHSGNGSLQLNVTQLCDGPSWTANVVTPAPGAGGPALKFFYKATPANRYTFAVTAAAATFTPVLDGAYHEGVICLNPKLAGRNQSVVFRMSGGGGTCAQTHPPEGAFVDDLVATTDASCPL